MNTIKIESDKKYILIPLEEYEKLEQFKKKIESDYLEEEIYLSDEDIKEIELLKEKARKGNFSEFMKLEDFKKELVKEARADKKHSGRRKKNI